VFVRSKTWSLRGNGLSPGAAAMNSVKIRRSFVLILRTRCCRSDRGRAARGGRRIGGCGAPEPSRSGIGPQGMTHGPRQAVERALSPTWSQQAELTASDGRQDGYFGWSVAVSGTYALVGASNADAAYVFVSDTPWWARLATTSADGRPTCSGRPSGRRSPASEAIRDKRASPPGRTAGHQARA
jgi:FG-GAP repeat